MPSGEAALAPSADQLAAEGVTGEVRLVHQESDEAVARRQIPKP